jgi:glycosyltransferase involved in cell wall biosynthesis
MTDFERQPKLGIVRRRHSKRFLLLCFFDPNGIAAVYENIGLWQRLSRYRIEVLNLWPGTGHYLTIPNTVSLEEFDGIILHSTVAYSPENLFSLDRRLTRDFSRYDGVKILMKQDEHRRSNSYPQFLVEKSFDILITCVPPEEVEKVYPRQRLDRTRIVHALTGYVPPWMRAAGLPLSGPRPVDICYRGSIQPLSFGRLGFEKRKIGYDVARACSGQSLKLDISSRWEDRVTGSAWFDFLARSKSVLGVESGSNLFDFTGEVEEWCRKFCDLHRSQDQLGEDFYVEAHQQYLKNYEDNVHYAQISPRHLEAAATGTLQLLYEGEYSGILIPMKHYFPLRRDLRNLGEALDFVADERRRRQITEAAFEEVVQDPRLQYSAFVAKIDDAIEAALREKGHSAALHGSKPTHAHKALLIMPHSPIGDPRTEWMAAGLARDYEVCEIGTYRFDERGNGPRLEQISDRWLRLRIERTRHDWDWVPSPSNSTAGSSVALRQLALLHLYGGLPKRVLARALGALDADDRVLGRFRELCRYFVNTNAALIEAARLTGSFDIIVAVDLESLPAALALAHENNAVVVYDAHEYWPYSYLDFRHWENEFWAGLERSLAPEAAIRITVSPQLAAHLAKAYGCDFGSVPNCCPLSAAAGFDIAQRLSQRQDKQGFDFLYQGVFAPGRGLDHLIRAWPRIKAPARLLLRGPANPYKSEMESLAASLGIKGNRVLFPAAVGEDELVRAASEADVGIIPYEPHSANHRFACPNKLSQYLAAGLPIISNRLEFVDQLVTGNGLGTVVDFSDTEALVQAVERLANRSLLNPMAMRAEQFFRAEFNWERVSAELYERIGAALRSRPITDQDFDFSWIEGGREMWTPAKEELRTAPPPAPPPPAGPFAAASTPAMSIVSPVARRSLPARAWRSTRIRVADLALHPRSRRLARSMLTRLPDGLGRRVKSSLVGLLDRLH